MNFEKSDRNYFYLTVKKVQVSENKSARVQHYPRGPAGLGDEKLTWGGAGGVVVQLVGA